MAHKPELPAVEEDTTTWWDTELNPLSHQEWPTIDGAYLTNRYFSNVLTPGVALDPWDFFP